jgi:hypothetical protein
MAAIDDPGSAEIVPGDVEPEDFGVLTAGVAEAARCLNPLKPDSKGYCGRRGIVIHDNGTHRDGEPRCGWRSSAAGWGRTFSWLDATSVSPKDFQNHAETLATFVILASVQLAAGGLPGSRSIGTARSPPVHWRRRTAVVGSVNGRSPAPTGRARRAESGRSRPQWNRTVRLSRDIPSWTSGSLGCRGTLIRANWRTCPQRVHVKSSNNVLASFKSAVLKPSVNQP